MKRVSVYLALFWAFLLGNHEGFIALWIPPNPEPVKVFPYSVTALPRADQELLKKGILVESKEKLDSLLEDYLS